MNGKGLAAEPGFEPGLRDPESGMQCSWAYYNMRRRRGEDRKDGFLVRRCVLPSAWVATSVATFRKWGRA